MSTDQLSGKCQRSSARLTRDEQSDGVSSFHVFPDLMSTPELGEIRGGVRLLSALALVHVGVVCMRVRRGDGAVLTDFLPSGAPSVVEESGCVFSSLPLQRESRGHS